MKIYNITHPEFPQALLRISVNKQGQVDKMYITNSGFITTAFAAIKGVIITVLLADDYIHNLQALGCTVKEDKTELATNVKVALWCRLWQEFKGEKWTISGPDARRLGEMKLDEELLRWYLNDADMPLTSQTWLWRGKQSIGNLWGHFNQVKVAISTPAPSKHPDFWSREHLMKLDGPGIAEYHRHLKSLGFVAKKHRDGSILDYVKP